MDRVSIESASGGLHRELEFFDWRTVAPGVERPGLVRIRDYRSDGTMRSTSDLTFRGGVFGGSDAGEPDLPVPLDGRWIIRLQ